jgi:hypothetical protein
MKARSRVTSKHKRDPTRNSFDGRQEASNLRSSSQSLGLNELLQSNKIEIKEKTKEKTPANSDIILQPTLNITKPNVREKILEEK